MKTNDDDFFKDHDHDYGPHSHDHSRNASIDHDKRASKTTFESFQKQIKKVQDKGAINRISDLEQQKQKEELLREKLN